MKSKPRKIGVLYGSSPANVMSMVSNFVFLRSNSQVSAQFSIRVEMPHINKKPFQSL